MPLFVSLLGFFFTGQVRYHYPAMPFVIVAAGWTVALWLNRRLPSSVRAIRYASKSTHYRRAAPPWLHSTASS